MYHPRLMLPFTKVANLNAQNDRQRRQFVSMPFVEKSRQMFEVATYINEDTGNDIEWMELVVCDPLDTPSSLLSSPLPAQSILMDPVNQMEYVCLSRLASQHQPLLSNQTIIKYPPGVALSLFTDQRLLLTIQYRNLSEIEMDDSGFELYLTSLNGASTEVLPFEAGIMTLGMVPDARFFIPPNMNQSWNIRGSCFGSCLASSLNRSVDQPDLNILGMFPSAGHSLLEEMVVEIDDSHSLNDVGIQGDDQIEKKKIFAWGGESSVDLGQVPTIKVGMDRIDVKCSYRSPTNASATGSILSDGQHENCLVWMHYYPRLSTVSSCLSSYTIATLMSMLNENELELRVAL